MVFKNRFRILKGGKISLVLSAMIVSSVFVSEAKAITCEEANPLTCERTTTKNLSVNEDYTITETGKINVSSNNSTYGIEYNSFNSTITNNGKISVSSNTLTYIYGIASINTPTINNSGTIEATTSSGDLKKEYFSLYLGGTVNNKVSGVLKGNILVSGTVNNKGLIWLPTMSNVNAWINNFTNEDSGILRVSLQTDGTQSGSTYSKLETYYATFKNGSTIDVDVLSSSRNVVNLIGSKLTDVVYSYSLTIDGKLNITDNSALLDFEYETSDGWANGKAGKIHLKAVQAKTSNGEDKTILSSTISGNGNKNSQNAAKALQGLYYSNNEIQSAFNKLPTDSSVARAVESTTPVATNSTVTAGTQISNGISNIVNQRQNANISSGGLNSGDGMFSENNLWIKPFAGFGKQNNKDGINGFDLKTYGLGFGADTEIKDNSKLGLAFFYTNADVDVNGVSQKADLDVFTGLVYGNVPIIDDKTNFLYQAGYSIQKTDTKRDIFTGQKAEAKYNSKIASLDLKLMRDVTVSDNLLLQPLVNTTYRHFINPAYSESGAGALNLNVDKFNSSEFIVGLGTLVHYKLTDNQKLVGNVNVGYDLKGDDNTITSSYMGASGVKFGTDGIDNGRWSYEAGIGYELDINKTNNINISYDYQAQGTKFSNNVISAKYVLKF